MKLKNILLCASVLGGLALSSCTGNFLDEDRNPNSLDPENFWKSESDILKGLTAAYAGLQPTIEWAQPFERYIVISHYLGCYSRILIVSYILQYTGFERFHRIIIHTSVTILIKITYQLLTNSRVIRQNRVSSQGSD